MRWWLLLILSSVSCAGSAEEPEGAEASSEHACNEEGLKQECESDGQQGTRTCQVGTEGFVWGPCQVAPSAADTCKQGDSFECFPEGSYMRQQFGNVKATCQLVDGRWTYPPQACATPLVLAFDDRPVQFTRAPGAFDLFGLSLSIGTDWVSARTPWLVLDRDGDGQITDGSELFGSMTQLADGTRAKNGFSALAALDSDRDGRITPRDDAFAALRLWSDADQDRSSSASELRSLEAAGIEAIELDYQVVPRCEASGCERERARFSFRDSNGKLMHGSVVDVHLRAL